ncbi:hypothetical protein M9H77_13663 [Catharanthus roseus]|uniref:Uncharacterized protein n=1 Tax=Catharanthus roseus TaxID=4058 RepID=A0ACC0BL35_CATRO|nr:hypothetical protein M9H77_13663 [Catharanthus roseus]
MENFGEDCVLSCDKIDLENCIALKSSGVDEGDLMLLESVTEEVQVRTWMFYSLIATTVIFEEDAFRFYNDYVFKRGFNICKGRKRCRAGEGKKFDKGKVEKCYSKVDICIDCKAMIEFRLNNKGGWTMSRHNNHAGYLQELKDSGVSTTAGVRVLKKQVGGSPFVDFTSGDAYNSLQLVKSNNLDLFLNGGATGIWKISIATKAILDKYILERWTKSIALSWGSSGVDNIEKVNNKGNVGSSVWRMGMLRKFSDLISARFKTMRARIVAEVGPYHVDDLGNKGSSILKDHIRSHAKGERNVRKKSIVEIRCNQVKGKRKNALMCASRNKATIQCTIILSLVHFHVLHTKDSTIYVVFTVLPWHLAGLYLGTSSQQCFNILAINTPDIVSVKLTVEFICKVCDMHFIFSGYAQTSIILCSTC